MKNKKGALNGMWIVGAIALITMYLFLSGGINLEGESGKIQMDSSNTVGQAEVDLSVTSNPGNLETSEVDNQYTVHISPSDLDDTKKTLSLGLEATIIDDQRNADGNYVDRIIEYDAESESFQNQDDSSDSSIYYPVEYVGDDDGYNINATEANFITENRATEKISLGSPAETTIDFRMNGNETLQKCTEDSFDTCDVATYDVKVDGNKVGSVVVEFEE